MALVFASTLAVIGLSALAVIVWLGHRPACRCNTPQREQR